MRPLRTSLLAAAALVLAVLATPLQTATVHADSGTVLNGPLLAELEAVGDGAVEKLDFLDGTRVELPFAPGGADFSPDGARMVYLGAAHDAGGVWRDAVLVRTAAGATSVLAFFLAEDVRWSGDGTYVVASAVDPGTGIWSLWRLTAGHAPVNLVTTPQDSPGGFFDVDPDSDLVTYLRYPDVYGVDALTKASSRLTSNCRTVDTCGAPYSFENLAWAPAGDRLLVRYRETGPVDSTAVDRLGWLTPGQQVPTPIRDFADNEYANNPLVSPDGTLVAFQVDDNSPSGSHTELLSASGAPVVPASLPLAHVSWQPCPAGAPCPVFVAPPATAPSRTGIGRAYSGASGGATTARSTWRAPSSNGGSAISSYRVQAMRLSPANHVVARVETTKPASARSARMALRGGRYKFRVRAINVVGAGSWSRASNIVRSR
jgi:hypothetical protein